MKLLALIKKEFLRFFRDPRMILTMLLPGIFIYALYSVMGTVMWNLEKEYEFNVYVQGESAVVEQIELFATSADATVEFMPVEDLEIAKKAVEEGEATALLIFSENFDESISTPNSGASVQIVYRSEDEASTAFYSIATEILGAYRQNFQIVEYDCTSMEGMFFSVIGSILPFLAVAMIFSACMGVTLEAIAGEKERGTLATILVTPVNRLSIAVGKVLPLSAISLLGATSSFLGIILSLPKLAGLNVGEMMGVFGFAEYVILFLLILSIVPVIVALISLLSTYAKSVKEASGYISVVMIFVIMLSLVSSFVPGIGGWVVAVPILNSVCSMQGVLSGGYVLWQAVLSIACNLVYAGLLVLGVAKMLSSERIMFGK